jgi:hypothetical protein
MFALMTGITKHLNTLTKAMMGLVKIGKVFAG